MSAISPEKFFTIRTPKIENSKSRKSLAVNFCLFNFFKTLFFSFILLSASLFANNSPKIIVIGAGLSGLDELFVDYNAPVTHIWPNDSFAKGSYSCIGVGQEKLFLKTEEIDGELVKVLFTPVNRTFFFDGEHTSIGETIGTMEVEVESGERTARLVQKNLLCTNMKHIEIVRSLFKWNTRNLVNDANLKKTDIADYFADSFLVIANGKSFEANHDNYFEFLNQFRSTIRKISYIFGNFVADKENVVIPLKAQIVRTNDLIENFEAILILKFNEQNKIVLWHEVYLKI